MQLLKVMGISGGWRICAVSALMLSCAWAARASVFDDAKFKLDLRGDANGNNYIDVGEVGNAFDFSSASPSYAFYGEKGVAKPYTCDFYPSQTVMRVALPLAAGDSKDQVCIASRGKVKKLCTEVKAGASADVSIRALRGSGGL